MLEKFLKEDLLQYLWNIADFDIQNLMTSDGQPIQIIERGVLNRDAGPDFLDSKIKINNTIWAGNIEIHKYSSDWEKHQHHKDPAYDNVILHVVFRDDKPVVRPNGEVIPTLSLYDRIRPQSTKAYHKLIYNKHWIPCQFFFPEVNSFVKSLWFEKLLIERLQNKTEYYKDILDQHTKDWESLLYIGIARYLSPNVNRNLMEELTLRTPLNILLKHKNDLSQLEAILFGQSGLLSIIENDDDYTIQLKKDYKFYQQKYNLTPMESVNWKFSKMRPLGFPTIRIAQLASYIYNSQSSFSKIVDPEEVKNVDDLFKFELSNYWKNHYRFGTITVDKSKKIGKSTINTITVNVIVPILFLYGKSKDDQVIKDQSLELLASIPAEKNSIITQWKKLGETPKTAYETQALLTLKTKYCDLKNCLSCDIGNAFMKTKE